MSKTRFTGAFLFILLVVFISSCSEFRKIQKNGDWKEKYDAALKYYEEEDYYKASVLLEDILPIIRGTEQAELANFYFAYAYYYQKQYVLSGHHFKTFFDTYNRSEYAMEALYMHGYSLYLQSSDYNLDQTGTYQAVAALQTFINRYPYSEYSEKATEVIDEMQFKLETKAFDNANQYYKLRRYKSAIVAFENFQKDYPDSRYQEEVAYLLFETEYYLARESIVKVQKERFEQAIEYYQDLVDTYPESEYVKQASNMYEDTVDRMRKISDNSL